jgi:hypothetical protein
MLWSQVLGAFTLPMSWAMEALEYGTTTSRMVLDAPGTERSQPSVCGESGCRTVVIDRFGDEATASEGREVVLPGRRRRRGRGRLGRERSGWPPPPRGPSSPSRSRWAQLRLATRRWGNLPRSRSVDVLQTPMNS